jgi:predicted enzyme related to lactoylglutathione lyase
MKQHGKACEVWWDCWGRARVPLRMRGLDSARRGKLKSTMPPTIGNGKICYIQIPATDIARSADFYHRVFGWKIRQREHGTAFDDGVGGVSGEWVLDRPPATEPGLLVYIMVDSVAATVEAIIANGGEIAQTVGADAPEITARFRDPGGNVIGIYQEPG